MDVREIRRMFRLPEAGCHRRLESANNRYLSVVVRDLVETCCLHRRCVIVVRFMRFTSLSLSFYAYYGLWHEYMKRWMESVNDVDERTNFPSRKRDVANNEQQRCSLVFTVRNNRWHETKDWSIIFVSNDLIKNSYLTVCQRRVRRYFGQQSKIDNRSKIDSFRIIPQVVVNHIGEYNRRWWGGGAYEYTNKQPCLAMEPECMEPLNLVIKKDDTDSRSTMIREKIVASIDERSSAESAIEDNMAILQDAVKSAESGLPTADHKLLTALYMSSLMQMSNMNVPRGITPSPYGGGGSQQQQQNFMQLLAMVEARHRMWQQMNWPLSQNFLRGPLTLPPQPTYFDSSTTTTNLTEQLCNSQNSTSTYPLSCAKPESLNSDAKQSYFNKRYRNISSKVARIMRAISYYQYSYGEFFIAGLR